MRAGSTVTATPMSEDPHRDQDLLGVEDVAERLGVQVTTVHRWCRDGRLQCLKPGKAWRIRPSSLDAFLAQGERPRTLRDHLRAFIAVPDHLVGLAEDAALMQRLDAAYFQVGEARGALLVKFIGGESASIETLRQAFRRNGLDIDRLEAEGRFVWSPAIAAAQQRDDALGQRLVSTGPAGQLVWACCNWTRPVDLELMLAQQEQLKTLVDPSRLVFTTIAVEAVLDDWTPATLRQAQAAQRGLMRISHTGLVLSRAVPLPAR
jgi:excisionase family DNA binding protein